MLEHREVVDCARGVRGHLQVAVLSRGGPVPDRGVRIAGGKGCERCVLRIARLRRPEPEELVDQPLAGIAQPVESGTDVPGGRGRRQRQDVRRRQLPIGLLDNGEPVGHPSDLPSGGRECQAGHPEGVLPVDLRRHPLQRVGAGVLGRHIVTPLRHSRIRDTYWSRNPGHLLKASSIRSAALSYWPAVATATAW